ncbi:MAG TPA: competence/damage-inducible protein A [Polyangiales bacterium]|nr:competence/damage-inducible protein A [Polyangiales bacterium]
MSAAVVAIGTELTRGELVNGNARWLSERLTELGFSVTSHVTVADDAERIRGTLLHLGQETKVIVCTGGLGPTSDDLTTQAVADALGVTLERDADSFSKIEARFRARNRVMSPSNAKQADFPQGAQILSNSVGTAPGFAVTIGNARAFFMPGVPREMQAIFDEQIAKQIAPLAERNSYQVHVRSYGLYESAVAQRLSDLDLGGALHDERVTIGYRVTFPEVEVKVLAESKPGEIGEAAASARALAEQVAGQVRERLGEYAFGGKEETYPRYVAGLLKRAGIKVALAESCTGGLVAKLLTDLAGSSEYVIGGAVSYANTAKTVLLGVSEALLREQGAVSEPVAGAMAEGILKSLGADLAVGITGIAGPTGGTPTKPVGTVCFGLARKNGATLTSTELFPGEREGIRTLAAYHALRLFATATKEILDGP